MSFEKKNFFVIGSIDFLEKKMKMQWITWFFIPIRKQET